MLLGGKEVHKQILISNDAHLAEWVSGKEGCIPHMRDDGNWPHCQKTYRAKKKLVVFSWDDGFYVHIEDADFTSFYKSHQYTVYGFIEEGERFQGWS